MNSRSKTEIHELPDLIIVRVEGYDKKNVTGEVYCPSLGKRYKISNVTQLVLRMKELANTTDGICADKSEIFEGAYRQGGGNFCGDLVPKRKKTFTVRICFDRYGTWQGILACLETGGTSFFRSALEMLLMMDSELESGEAVPEAEEC